MAKPTVTSLTSRVDKLEAVSEERFQETINRIKRLEMVIVSTGAATIILLLNLVIYGS